MTHAFLVIANKDQYTLNALLRTIDADNHDVFLLVDSKSKLKDEDIGTTLKKSKIFFLKRMNIMWGTNSQINAELALFKEATNGRCYDYYHIISGQDLILRSVEEFDAFFTKIKGQILLNYCGEEMLADATQRIRYYHFFIDRKNHIKKALHKGLLLVQKVFRVDRTKKINLPICVGSNWCALTHEVVEYVLLNIPTIDKIFKHTCCGDEMFIQMLVANSKYKDIIYKPEEKDMMNRPDRYTYLDNQRYVHWINGTPRAFKKEDYPLLMNTGVLFARKFDSSIDKEIIDMVLENHK